MKNDSAKAKIRRAYELVREAKTILQSVDTDDTREGSIMGWVAGCSEERLSTIAGDLQHAAAGAEDLYMVPPRVELVPIGRPQDEDSGGGFAHRALQALALLREARGNADQNNAPRIERAMGWVARAWLGTAGYNRAHVARSVLTWGWDPGFRDKVIARVNEAMAEDSEARAILAKHGKVRSL